MRPPLWMWVLLLALTCTAQPLLAQLPFYTDNPQVTDRGTFHFEFFNEFDGLQSSQYPNLHQNWANFKFNYGLPRELELDLDYPYLSIYRAPGQQSSSGIGDVDMGIKWNFRTAPPDSQRVLLAASLYIEAPTGNVHQQLGSGLADVALNLIGEKPFSSATRLNLNLGFLFAGNTSTGAVGIQTTRGHVVTGGASLLHDFTPRLTLGVEAYGGVADNDQLGRRQLQGLLGAEYTIRNGLGLAVALLGGKYEASPRIGGQIGFQVDIPAVVHSPRSGKSFKENF
ncbi:MAG: hypothetical protein WAM71_13390 [Candidatus Korobacteraceae bacterium]